MEKEKAKAAPGLAEIFLLFMRIGATIFGGGYAMLPIVQHELADKRGWLSDAELADIYALAQCQPGIIIVNSTVLIMRPRFGLKAALAAVLGVITPSLAIILLLAALLGNFAHITLVQQAFAGIRVAVAALVLKSAWRLVKSGVTDIATGCIYAAALALLLFGIAGALLIVAGAAVVGPLLHLLGPGRRNRP